MHSRHNYEMTIEAWKFSIEELGPLSSFSDIEAAKRNLFERGIISKCVLINLIIAAHSKVFLTFGGAFRNLVKLSHESDIDVYAATF